MKGKDIFPVLVIGGGVAGIGAALAMADAGRRVHLVEINTQPLEAHKISL